MIKASDIPETEIIDAIKAVRGRNGVPRWATTWDVVEHLDRYPAKVVLARVRAMIRRGVIDGHVCSLDEVYVDSEGWLLFSIETDEGALIMRVPPWVMERVWGPRKEGQ